MVCPKCLNFHNVLAFLLQTCLKVFLYCINRYNFLDKSVGLSSLCEINGVSVVNSASSVVETQRPLCVPGLEGFLIPSKTRGHILKLIDGNTALVRWEVHDSNFNFPNGLFLDFFCGTLWKLFYLKCVTWILRLWIIL